MKNQTTKGAFGNLNPKNKLLIEKLIEIDYLVKGLEQTGLMNVMCCEICGGLDLSAQDKEGGHYGTIGIILPDLEDEIDDFYEKNIDPYKFYCNHCVQNVELTRLEDFKSDNSEDCCPNCGNTNYECLSEKNHVRECAECDIENGFWPIKRWEFLLNNDIITEREIKQSEVQQKMEDEYGAMCDHSQQFENYTNHLSVDEIDVDEIVKRIAKKWDLIKM